MGELAQILAFVSAALMAVSFAIWSNWLRGPMLQRLDGRRASNTSPGSLALKLLMVAFGVGVIAAALALLGRMFP
jgi:hypothetical protein